METKTVPNIRIEHPTPGRIATLNISSWPIWEKDVSTFDWEYPERETCYLLFGRARIRTGVEAVEIRAGELVTFPKGLKCTWTILEAVKKHYKFG